MNKTENSTNGFFDKSSHDNLHASHLVEESVSGSAGSATQQETDPHSPDTFLFRVRHIELPWLGWKIPKYR